MVVDRHLIGVMMVVVMMMIMIMVMVMMIMIVVMVVAVVVVVRGHTVAIVRFSLRAVTHDSRAASACAAHQAASISISRISSPVSNRNRPPPQDGQRSSRAPSSAVPPQSAHAARIGG